jgi:hypothetical protein
MLYWESKHRLSELLEFRELVVTYFRHRTIPHFDTVCEDDTARRARDELNLRMNAAIRSCFRIGESLTVFYSPPPAIGGFTGDLNLIRNMFDLHSYHIPPARIVDALDRAIGDYKRLQCDLYRSLWNPFYWLRLGFTNLLGVPFRILDAAGFDARAMEQTIGGKVAKAIIGFVTLLAGVLTILSLLGFSTTWQHLSGLFRPK